MIRLHIICHHIIKIFIVKSDARSEHTHSKEIGFLGAFVGYGVDFDGIGGGVDDGVAPTHAQVSPLLITMT